MRRLALVALFAAACGPTPTPTPGQSLYLTYHKDDVYRYSFQLTAQETIDTVQETFHAAAGQGGQARRRVVEGLRHERRRLLRKQPPDDQEQVPA